MAENSKSGKSPQTTDVGTQMSETQVAEVVKQVLSGLGITATPAEPPAKQETPSPEGKKGRTPGRKKQAEAIQASILKDGKTGMAGYRLFAESCLGQSQFLATQDAQVKLADGSVWTGRLLRSKEIRKPACGAFGITVGEARLEEAVIVQRTPKV